MHLKTNIFCYKAVKYGGGPDALDGRSHRVEANLKRSSTRYHLCQSGSTGSSKLECFQRICFFFKNPIFKKESDGIINSRCAVAQVYGVGTIVFRKWRVFYPGFNELGWGKQIFLRRMSNQGRLSEANVYQETATICLHSTETIRLWLEKGTNQIQWLLQIPPAARHAAVYC